jgi:hypothetical protein
MVEYERRFGVGFIGGVIPVGAPAVAGAVCPGVKSATASIAISLGQVHKPRLLFCPWMVYCPLAHAG